MHVNGHGIIGAKLIGNGKFTNAADREKSIRFAMAQPEIHAVTIGCKSPAEIDEASTSLTTPLPSEELLFLLRLRFPSEAHVIV